jgi:integrase
MVVRLFGRGGELGNALEELIMSIYKKKYTRPLPKGAVVITRNGNRHATWIGHNGKKCIAPLTMGRDGSDRIRMETATLTVKVRDASGVVQSVNSGCRTREAAQAIQNQMQHRSEMIKAGVISAAEDKVSAHATTPIEKHIDEYLVHLSRNASALHVRNVRHQIVSVVKACGFRRLPDLDANLMDRWLSLRKAEGVAPRTGNTYLAAMKAFANWAVKEGRLTVNPLARVERYDEKVDQRRQRRSLTEDEVKHILTVAQLRPVAEYGRGTEKLNPSLRQPKRSNWRRSELNFATIMDDAARGREVLSDQPAFLEKLERRGRERALIYKTLVLTGLRRGELASITVGQVELESDPACIHLHAADGKNREAATIPLRADLADDIRAHLAGHRPELRFGEKVQNLDPV